MIIGIGVDLCDIRRIEKVVIYHQERFIHRIFTATEIGKAEKQNMKLRLGTYAKRWAAKEAFVKALGTGFTNEVYYKDIEVVNNEYGKPGLKLYNGALHYLENLIDKNKKANILLTMTDEYPYAFAQVMIETLPTSVVNEQCLV